MSQITGAKPPSDFGHYDANYGHFQTDIYAEIRREAFGVDIGQSSWITADEQDHYLEWLNLSKGKVLLDVACGSAGPALRIAEKTQCSIVGIDAHQDAISTANALAAERGFGGRAEFQVVDAAGTLPFPENQFDAITCIDAINHLPNRPYVIGEWFRILKPGGRLLFTDPITITGPLTKEEITVRSSIGFFLFVPVDYDQRVLQECGFKVLLREDATQNMADLAARRGAARAARSKALRTLEGEQTYEGQQKFFEVAARIAGERRLSRFLYIAEKPR
jgi:ubiquinone/menaquinone biosynthesis C-methylase UbiE